ncbi:MAG: hypothetical protein MK101_11010 [Phycisphaerales bacterium]|nr:hypothetical protein [Phycisphaerales bacterium]
MTDSTRQYNLAPSATPAAMYGLLSVLLCWVPLVGLLLAAMGLLRARTATTQLRLEARFQGQGLVSTGIWLSIAGLALGVVAIVWWIRVML